MPSARVAEGPSGYVPGDTISIREVPMGICDTCGNDYDRTFTVRRGEETGTFDSFECAVSAMAPVCGHCGCRVLGHGVEAAGVVYCCASCARRSADADLSDRA
ncbi:hypothetical protein [Aeromicrobium piscarium]|nr:hypothetical protein [Aeromicrobium piscarium]